MGILDKNREIKKTSNINMSGAEIKELSVDDVNFTNKNITVIKRTLDEIPLKSEEGTAAYCPLYSVFQYVGEDVKSPHYDTTGVIFKKNHIYQNTGNSTEGYIVWTNITSSVIDMRADNDDSDKTPELTEGEDNDIVVYYKEDNTYGKILTGICKKINGSWKKYTFGTFGENTKTKITVGKLELGSDISNKTPLQVLRAILIGDEDMSEFINVYGSLGQMFNAFDTVNPSQSFMVNSHITNNGTGRTIDNVKLYWTNPPSGEEILIEEASGGGLGEMTLTSDAVDKICETLGVEEKTNKAVYEALGEDVPVFNFKGVCTFTDDPDKEYGATTTITLSAPSYYGYGTSSTEIVIGKAATTLTYTGDLISPFYKYPAIFGTLTSITDTTGMDDYTKSFELTTEEINGITYNVYTKIVPSTHTNFSYVFI